jgi:hypothetical protein
MAKADAGKPKGEAKHKLKLTNKERHKRFLAMAREVEASENQKDFDEAFKKVAIPKKQKVAP